MRLFVAIAVNAFLCLPATWREWFWPPIWSNWGLVAVAAFAASAAFSTLNEIKKQAISTQKAANAARDNARAVINAERAWLFPSIVRTGLLPEKGSWAGYQLRIKNVGKTPAHLISSTHYYKILSRGTDLPQKPDYSKKGEFESTIVVLPGKHYVVDDIELSFVSWLNKEPALDTGEKVIWQYGLIQYRDVIQNSPIRETGFCFRYFRELQEWRTAGPKDYTEYS